MKPLLLEICLFPFYLETVGSYSTLAKKTQCTRLFLSMMKNQKAKSHTKIICFNQMWFEALKSNVTIAF